jgi:hypothetical protein
MPSASGAESRSGQSVTRTCDLRHSIATLWGRDLLLSEWAMGAVMIAKCSNPSCPASFRYLEQGLLFRLETDPTLRLSHPMMPEYHWLCRSCSATMTLHISKEGKVIPVAIPARVHCGLKESDFILTERQQGLLLSGVSFSAERHRRHARFVG